MAAHNVFPEADIETSQFMHAVLNNNTEEVKEILTKSPGIQTKQVTYHKYPTFSRINGYHALLLATEANILSMVEVLMGYGANPCQKNATGFTSLHSAAKRGNPDIMKALLQGDVSDINIVNCKGKTPFMVAAEENKVHIIRMLKDKGADVNKVDNVGDTPLHVASRKGYSACVKVLLTCGADRSRQNHEGKNALDVATNPGVQAELKILTSQELLSLSERITNKADLKKLAIKGLKMEEHVVEQHMTNEKGDISSAAHKVLQDWKKSIESDKVAYNKMWEALGVVGFNGLKETLLN